MTILLSRRKAIVTICAGALSPFLAHSQQPSKIPLIGVLHPGLPPPAPPSYAVAALQKGLRDLGYVEGKTIAVEYRYAGGKSEALPSLASELVRLKPDVLVAIGTAPTGAARAAAGNIPMVVTDTQTDPVASGLIASFAKPGGTITGLFLELGGLMGKMLEILTQTAPGIRRVAVLWDSSTGPFRRDTLMEAATKLSITLDVLELKQASQLGALLEEAVGRKAQALIQLPSPIISQLAPAIAKFTLANRLPSISIFALFPESGGLMSYGPDLPVYFGRIAPLVQQVLKGAKAGDIPIERPTKFEMVVNLKTAKALGVKMPNAILLQATRIIE